MKGKEIKTALFAVLGILFLQLSSCKKETIFTYEVEEVTVTQPGAVKPHLKTDLEVISIAYTDLFARSIPPDELEALAVAYQAFGDKRIVLDMIILNYLNDPQALIPTDATMRGNIEGFVEDCYEKFFVRKPTAFEQWFVSDLIRRDAGLSPDLVYYAFMTSTEYRFY